jgi:catechol 2,3-dioxygenase-like lactoylglutathione lyase family enzyme
MSEIFKLAVACPAMNVQFISTFAVISPDVDASRKFYVDALGLPLTSSEGDEYLHSEQIDGAKHFGVWPLSQAAEASFGTPEWPADRTLPAGERRVRRRQQPCRCGRRRRASPD